jgi:hypothetical protein
MKIVLTTTLVALLAIALLGISNIGNSIDNAFAQGDGMMGNDTGTMNATLATSGTMNATLATSGTMNATLAFALGNDTMTMKNDTSMIMNATLPMNIMDKNNTSSN